MVKDITLYNCHIITYMDGQDLKLFKWSHDSFLKSPHFVLTVMIYSSCIKKVLTCVQVKIKTKFSKMLLQ